MNRSRKTFARLMCSAAFVALGAFAGVAHAADAGLDIAPQPLAMALKEFGMKTGQPVLYGPALADRKMSSAVVHAPDAESALIAMLDGTGLTYRRNGDTFLIVSASDPQSGSAAGDGAEGTVQALIVTAQKREENIQDVPIAMSAFTQEDLTRSQVAGGPDLMTQIPNMTYTKTNFSSYSIQIRGIGTQAISATTDAAVAVAFNNTPFIRNRFFEQEFYDLERVEVLRGPQGTLYGRNATAGVVNIISAKPTFHYEAKLSADVGNYKSTRFEGMVNMPLVDDKVALRIAGAWTKRDGYDTNAITGNQIDGRDLWSTRTSLRIDPTDHIGINLIWEHFQENDDRLRSGKQLCHQDNRSTVGGLLVVAPGVNGGDPGATGIYSNIYSQGCLPASLYSPDSFQAPNGYSLPYFLPLRNFYLPIAPGFNPYASLVQSPNLRVIESTVDPKYRAKSDLVELQWHVDLGNTLTLTSETAHNSDTIFSSEDYNRFNTASGAFLEDSGFAGARSDFIQPGPSGGIFCDPQVGCADRLVAVDVSRAQSSQFSQEFRLSSNYAGPFNFSVGANFLRYDTMEKYYVFINTLTMFAAKGGGVSISTLPPWQPGVSDNRECFHHGFVPPNPNTFQEINGCPYIDPNPIDSVNDLGHNYFLSKNPYKLISYAVFGEAYYNITENLKLTAGLRWTVDKKESPRIPSMLLAGDSVGLSVLTLQEQEWREPTGRLTLDWKPDLAFTDQTLLYASYAHGYKAGGSNPPPSSIVTYGGDAGVQKFQESVLKPKTFDPEFVNAFEVGAKNTLLEGRLTLNADAFYYDYRGYQVSQIIDRSAVNYNFDSKIWGLELEADWRPLENLRLGFKGGYEHTRIDNGMKAIDIMDRTAGHSDWLVIRPFPTYPSNCILPAAVFNNGISGSTNIIYSDYENGFMGPCEYAYTYGLDPVTQLPYVPNPSVTRAAHGSLNDPATVPLATAPGWSQRYIGYPGFNPAAAPNHGEGFFKQLGGNELPNAPHFTATITADYTIPLPSNWLMTLHTDLYGQSEAWTRVFNMPGYDKIKAYTNVNVAAIFTNDDAGWKVMAYVKNVFNRDSITGAFLNSDDTGLTTNVFLTEPRLYGLRVTKEWTGNGWWTGTNPNHPAGEPYPLTIEIGGQVQRQDARKSPVVPDFAHPFSAALDPTTPQRKDLDWGDGRDIRVTYKPSAAGWSVMAGFRYGKANNSAPLVHKQEAAGPAQCAFLPDGPLGSLCDPAGPFAYEFFQTGTNWSDASAREREEHRIVDFAVGRDFDIGSLGHNRSTVSAGLRYAQFDSTTRADMNGIPDWNLGGAWVKYSSRHEYGASIDANRKFRGAGPTLSWDAAQRLLGNETVGHVDVDWSVTGGVLFGKQKTTATGTRGSSYYSGNYGRAQNQYPLPPLTPTPVGVAPRDKSATVPLVDLSLGLSYEIQRVKVGAGYHWERYFNVLDAGYGEHKNYDRTFDGPYFKIAVGFGG
jgi:outer membrane receptor protein involved in Fe transport